jgi:L-histidine Nalpha-methyltransferase
MPSASLARGARVVVARDSSDARRFLEASTAGSIRGDIKELPARWLYDALGSRLYEAVTRLPQYYLPRREAEILRGRSAEIAARTRARTLVELGAGAAANTRLLLDALHTLERFVALDVSEQALRGSASAIAVEYPRLDVRAIVGDFDRDLALLPPHGPRLVAFLGSTIGNLYPAERERLLATLAGAFAAGDALLLGVDLVKDVARLERAYNDGSGVTEAFARNALVAVNRELDATFDQRRFVYSAQWDAEHEWMDVGFRARGAQTVSIRRLGVDLDFEDGEPLRIEISAKFRRARFELEAARAGLGVDAWWTDRANDFAVALLRAVEPHRSGEEPDVSRRAHL